MLTTGKTQEALDLFKDFVINQSKSRLAKKNASKKLSNSIDGKVKLMPNSIKLSFFMEDYGYYQDLGVRGYKSTYALTAKYKTKAKFGKSAGKGKTEGGLSDSIQQWVKSKRFQFRDKKSGKFMSYQTTAFLISRSIYNKGLKPSLFFTKPFERAFRKLPEQLIEAYGLDVEDFLKFTLNKK
tara:strand:- start:25 stop:570 length:546 start_codon:yes stop_codon:yes gene_type:complete